MFIQRWIENCAQGRVEEKRSKPLPPVVLVETWVQMALSDECIMVQEKAIDRILRFFDSFEEAKRYIGY